MQEILVELQSTKHTNNKLIFKYNGICMRSQNVQSIPPKNNNPNAAQNMPVMIEVITLAQDANFLTKNWGIF